MTNSVTSPETSQEGSIVSGRGTAIARVLLAALVAGPITGWLHTIMIAIERFVTGGFAWYSREFVWMSPVAYTLCLVAASLPLVLVALVRPSLAPVRVAVGYMVVLAVFGLLLPWPQVGRLPSLILAIGAGVQAARWFARHESRFERQASRLVVAELVLVAAIALGQPVVRQVREQLAIARLPDAAPGAPNVLLIILDTVRASSLSLYGFPAPTTPRLAEWATQGTTFNWAMAPAPWTLPSHASYLSGRYPSEMTANWEVPLDRETPILTEAFRGRGYYTAAVMANLDYTAFDSGLQRGFAHFEDYPVSWTQLLYSTSYTQTALGQDLLQVRSVGDIVDAFEDVDLSIDSKHKGGERRAHQVTENFLAWQRSHADRPFFAMLNYFDAHQEYYAPRGFPRLATPVSPRYHTAIAWLDQNIDSLLSQLRDRGVLDNTLVIVTSDHGELFNEHGLSGHANNLYRNVLHVPLVLRFPGRVPAGQRVNREVTTRDLAATVADLAGLRDSFPGASLRHAWEGDSTRLSPVLAHVRLSPNVSPTFPTARGDLAAIFDATRHYIRNYGGGEELFDYRSDSLERLDFAKSDTVDLAPYRTRLERLTGRKE